MKIFISYSSERHQIAEKLSISLNQDGHDVFFDKRNLPEGISFDNLIRDELSKTDLLIFLISPESVEPGSYTLSELQIFQYRFPNPSGRLLPVMISTTVFKLIPNYLSAVTILQPTGNSIADIAASVSKIASRRKIFKFKRISIIITVLFLAAAIIIYFSTRHSGTITGIQMKALKGISIFAEPNQDSRIVRRMNAGDEFIFIPEQRKENWALIRLNDGREGWVMAQDMSYVESTVKKIDVGRGFGFRGNFWQLFFTSPQPDSIAQNQFGIDARFADAIDQCHSSLKIAVFEFNSRIVMDAIIEAKQRGVLVQVVTDNQSLSRDSTFLSIFNTLTNAGIPIKTNKKFSGLMHDKFAILDEKIVWTGSWNFTDGATYHNNENEIVLESPQIAAIYNKEFKKMFVDGLFGQDKLGLATTTTNSVAKTNGNLPFGLKVYFAPEDNATDVLVNAIANAKSSVKFMAFLFNSEELANILKQKAQNGIVVKGIVEQRLSYHSKISLLIDSTNNAEIRLDGNKYFLHHNSIIIDDKIVITGSLNFSMQSAKRNDENMVLIPDVSLAAKYNEEFQRLWPIAKKMGNHYETK